MSANILGPKKIRKLQQMTGLPIEKALVWSHNESGQWADCRIVHDDGSHEHILVHRRTGEVAPQGGMHWSSRDVGAAPAEGAGV